MLVVVLAADISLNSSLVPAGGIAITSNVTFVAVTSRETTLDMNLQTNVLFIKVGPGQGLAGRPSWAQVRKP